MTISHIILLAISTSIILTVFALGLDARPKDLIWLFQCPGLLVRSVLSMNIIMVVLAVGAATFFRLAPAIKVAIVALALSPVPPTLPKKEHKTGGSGSYSVGLLAAAALLSIILIPLWLKILGNYFGFVANPALIKLLPIIFTKILLPLVAGTLVGKFAPAFAEKLAKPVKIIALVLLIAGVLPVLFFSWRGLWGMIGTGVVVTMVLFALVGIGIGFLLGGPNPYDRSILALATSARHPGIAIAIAALTFPDRKNAVLMVVLYHLILGSLVAIPFVKWTKGRHAELAEAESVRRIT